MSRFFRRTGKHAADQLTRDLPEIAAEDETVTIPAAEATMPFNVPASWAREPEPAAFRLVPGCPVREPGPAASAAECAEQAARIIYPHPRRVYTRGDRAAWYAAVARQYSAFTGTTSRWEHPAAWGGRAPLPLTVWDVPLPGTRALPRGGSTP